MACTAPVVHQRTLPCLSAPSHDILVVIVLHYSAPRPLIVSRLDNGFRIENQHQVLGGARQAIREPVVFLLV